MKRKFMVISLCILLLALFSVSVCANEMPIRVIVNGKTIEMDQDPYIKNSRTLVPVRFVGENLGASVEWDGTTQKVTAVKDGKTIVLTIGKRQAVVDGKNINLDVAPEIAGTGRTMVPLRFIAEGFNTEVEWVDSTRTVYITTKVEAKYPIEPVEFPSWVDEGTKANHYRMQQRGFYLDPRYVTGSPESENLEGSYVQYSFTITMYKTTTTEELFQTKLDSFRDTLLRYYGEEHRDEINKMIDYVRPYYGKNTPVNGQGYHFINGDLWIASAGMTTRTVGFVKTKPGTDINLFLNQYK